MLCLGRSICRKRVIWEKGVSPRKNFVGVLINFFNCALGRDLTIPVELGECVSAGKSNEEESRVGRSEEEFVIFSRFGHYGLNA